MIHAGAIAETVDAYLRRHPSEAGRLAPLTEALAQGGDPTWRRTFTGHVTCSAIVFNRSGRVLHLRHHAGMPWLRPGGHLEPDDVDLASAARRVTEQETGVPAGDLRLADDLPVDIDAHAVPANLAVAEPGHQHFDVRHVFALAGVPATPRQAEEVRELAWLPVDKVEPTALRDKLAAWLDR